MSSNFLKAADAQEAAMQPAEQPETLGPYDMELLGRLLHGDEVLKGITYNRKEHPIQYLLNPYVPGPGAELATRYMRRIQAGKFQSWPRTLLSLPTLGVVPALYGGAERQDEVRNADPELQQLIQQREQESMRLPNKQAPTKQAAAVPPRPALEATHSTNTKGLNAYLAAMELNQQRHPGHYAFNPFVSGPVTKVQLELQRRREASRASSAASRRLGVATDVLGGLVGGIGGGLDLLPVDVLGDAISAGGDAGSMLHGGPRHLARAQLHYLMGPGKQESLPPAYRETAENLLDEPEKAQLSQLYPVDQQKQSNFLAGADRLTLTLLS